MEKKQTIQWPKEKVQKDKQRSTKHTHNTKDQVTRIPLRAGGEHRCSGRISSSFSTSGTRRANLVTLTAQIEPVQDEIIIFSYHLLR